MSAAGVPPPAAARTARRPHLVLRFALLGGLVVIAGAIGLSLFGRPRPSATPLSELETGEGVAQRALNMDSVRTRRGLPSLNIKAEEVFTYENGITEMHNVSVTIFGSDGGPTVVSAPRAVSGESGGGWSFRDGVEISDEKGLRLRVPEIRYRENPQEVSADGEVEFARDHLTGRSKGMRYFVGRRRLELLADVQVDGGSEAAGIRAIRSASAVVDQDESKVTYAGYTAEGTAGETIRGRQLESTFDSGTKRLRAIHATGGFDAQSPGGGAESLLLGRGAKSLAGDDLTVALGEDGAVQSLVATGGVKAALPDASGGSRNLSSERLDIAFEGGRTSSLTAQGGAVIDVPAQPGRTQGSATVNADKVVATMGTPGGSVSQVTADGQVRANESGRRLFASHLTFDADASDWVLEGAPGSQARTEGEGSAVTADRIEIHRNEGTLLARGNVKSLSLARSAPASDRAETSEGGEQTPSRTASNLFGGGGPIHGMSDSLAVSRSGRVGRYRGRVRLWQGSSSLEAASVDASEDGGTLDATGGVVARVPGKRKGSTEPQILTISAPEMHYARESDEIRFAGGVRVQSADMRVTCDRLLAKGGGGSGGVKKSVADGNVSFQQGARSGTGDSLDASIEEERYVLSGHGRLAIIQDQSSQQVVKGSVLTYESDADRILVESESGGRTWITLKPRPGERKKSGDPEPPR